MNHRKQQRGHNGKNRHRLGSAIDRGTPFLAEQKQDRRNQSSRVTNPDPKNEGDDHGSDS